MPLKGPFIATTNDNNITTLDKLDYDGSEYIQILYLSDSKDVQLQIVKQLYNVKSIHCMI
jgi:hypothetical protein